MGSEKVYAVAPTPERARHGQKIVPYRATDMAGVYAARAVGECLLDRLLATGYLGQYRQGEASDEASRDAMRRFHAGMWLREVYFDAGLGRASASGWSRQPSRGYEMSDPAAEALARYEGVHRTLGLTIAHRVVEVSCRDRLPRAPRRAILKSFDALAKLPGVEVK